MLVLCAGSGCIGLAVASQTPGVRVVLGEYSDAALKICRQNIRRNGLSGRVVPIQADALEKPERTLGEFQCIISNPPYIPRGDIAGLDASVREYEPHLALDGGEDGLDFYRSIAQNYAKALRPGGYLCFEYGAEQGDAVQAILEMNGYTILERTRDYNDRDRAILARYGRKEDINGNEEE